MRGRGTGGLLPALCGGGLAAFALAAFAQAPAEPGAAPISQTQEDANRKSAGCVTCHLGTDSRTMHRAPEVRLGCTDCHGGDAAVRGFGGRDSDPYRDAMRRAHVRPRDDSLWRSSANPQRSYTAWLDESLEFVRFVNPGDLRAAPSACGPCHPAQVRAVSRSLMTHGAMLYGAALYNNGVLPGKDPIVGESYGPDGRPRALVAVPPPTPEQSRLRGWLARLVPFPRWELSQPGNRFRVFEPGGAERAGTGQPDVRAEPGRPDAHLSPRGPGTLARTDPMVLGAQKTRLFDPLLSMLGTNDHPGDYRSSGCSACHVVYANDRTPAHSGPWAENGNRGQTASEDPTIPRREPGHPLRHELTRRIPSSQCMTCHMHPGTSMVASYLGYTWWDNEADGRLLYPRRSRTLSGAQRDAIEQANPEGAALRGLWSDPDFLAEVRSLNDRTRVTRFGDFHSHGWIFRAVFKRDRHGQLLDAAGAPVPQDAPDALERAVHMKDIHLEKGMHCVDCHFSQDVHGDGHLYGEPRAAIEIACVDCHGSVKRRASLVTSGPAATGTDLAGLSTPWGEPRFRVRSGVVTQRSMVEEGLEWEVAQVLDTITPGNPRYSEASRLAKTLRRDGRRWGDATAAEAELAHSDERMTCDACHSGWTTACFGCHLRQRANARKPNLHADGTLSRNWTSYNFQTLRDDTFMLARDGTVTGGRVAPARSSCAVVVSSQNQDREWLYFQQQTISSAGFSGTAFSTHVPHTVRGAEARVCDDCHLSGAGDNNAWMAQLLMQGTGLVNFIGRYAWVGEGPGGFEAVVVTERDEPQAVIGSDLQALAWPDEYRAHRARGDRLETAHHHGGDVQSLQLWGEYLFAAEGTRGLRVYDVAQVGNKGFSQRLVSAPVSPLGQRLSVDTADAAWVALPTTQTVDASRVLLPGNQEQRLHPLYDYAYVADRREGLVVVGPLHTLVDGEPRNNRLRRVAAFDAGGALFGATSVTLAGSVAWVTTPQGLAAVSIDDPLRPALLARLGAPGIVRPRAVAVQFRYAFVTDAEGLKVVDVTDPARPRVVPGAEVPLADARHLFLARTWAYVAAGRQGLAIVDIERPSSPRLDRLFDAGGRIDDLQDVQVGMTNGSAFAYLADGRNGLRVVQIVSANATPGAYGFSPRPTPMLIASRPTRGPALALSRGIDRDRAVDETGNQIAVFGRRGARPFTRDEQQRLYLREGALYTVEDRPPTPPLPSAAAGRENP